MNDEDLYNLRVETTYEHRQLCSITGTRETVIDVALRVILDNAPSWRHDMRPMFSIDVWKVSK